MFELIDICKHHLTDLILNLIENKADLDLQDKYGRTALIISYYYNTESTFKLIENKVNQDLQGKE